MRLTLSAFFFGVFLALATVAGVGIAAAETVQASGSFVGASNHVTTGGVSIVKAADGSVSVVLADDFSLDGAPDPRVGLGKDGTYDPKSDLGVLANNTGAQTYSLPAGLDASAYNEVYIWCKKFSVPLGVAAIK